MKPQEMEAALFSRDDAKLLEVTPDMLRVRVIDDLDELIEELDAAVSNYVDATGGSPLAHNSLCSARSRL